MAESNNWHLIRVDADQHVRGQGVMVAGELLVGRSSGAGLQIREGHVSRSHARLWVEAANQLMVEDLGSANGTFVNGKRLTQGQLLRPGDLVRFDETEFQVALPEDAADLAAATSGQVSGTVGAAPGLLFLSGSEAGALYQLTLGRISVGSGPDCDISSGRARGAGYQIELLVTPDKCQIYASPDSGKIYVNEQSLADSLLKPGDVIRLGRVRIRFGACDLLAEGGVDQAASLPWRVLAYSLLSTLLLVACLILWWF